MKDGPYHEVNLIKFKAGGLSKYQEYLDLLRPHYETFGGTIQAMTARMGLVGEPRWDFVAVATYPNKECFMKFAQSEIYQKIRALREEAIETTEVIVAGDSIN